MASHHEESDRSDSRRDQIESKKSVDKATGSKTSADVKATTKSGAKDDDWGYEPKKAGMAIEAKMGMCIVVILLSAFGFLVYRKFDARQRDLLQANLQAAEQALPGSTGSNFVGEFSEFQATNDSSTNNAVDAGVTEPTTSADIALQDLDSDVSFGSSFALQDESSTEAAATREPSALMADHEQESPFANTPQGDTAFGSLAEPEAEVKVSEANQQGEFANLALASETAANRPAGQMTSPLDDYYDRRLAKKAAEQPELAVDDSSFAIFDDPQQAAAETNEENSFGGNQNDRSELADAPPFGDSPQVAESNAPSFVGFPAGFGPDAASIENGEESTAPSDVWVKTDKAGSGGQLETFPQTSADAFDKTIVVETPSTEVKATDLGSSQAFAGFDSFADETTDTQIAAAPAGSEEVNWSSGDSSSEDTDLKTAEPAIIQPPNFADFEPTDDSPFDGTGNRSRMGTSPKEQQTVDVEVESFPSRFGESFDSFADSPRTAEVLAEASRPSLSPFTGSESNFESTADSNSRRRPSIDPTAVVDPLNKVSNQENATEEGIEIQLAQSDFPRQNQPWESNGEMLPIESDRTTFVSRTDSSDSFPQPPRQPSSIVDPALANSFGGDSGFQQLPSNIQPDPTSEGAENLKMPTLPYVQQAAKTNEGKSVIQQVSATRDPDGIYTVKPDDTYWTISKKVYGTARFFSSLALYNKNRIKDPRKLREGMKVVIPDPQVLIERYPELLQDYIPKKTLPSGYFLKPDRTPAYRIGERETLSEISQKHLGRASRWIQLYRMNQHVLKNPNRLKPGTVIDLPDDATNVHMVP